MATNSLLTTHLVTYEALRILKGNLNFVKHLNREYQGEFGKTGMKVGEIISIRKPVQYAGRTGVVAIPETTVETYVPLALDKNFGVDCVFDMNELYLSIDDFGRRYIKPAMNTIRQKVEAHTLAAMTDATYNTLGTPGVPITDFKLYNQVNAVISSNGGTHTTDRTIVLDPFAAANASGLTVNFFNPQPAISEQYKTGLISQALNMSWYEVNNVTAHTVGVYGGVPVVTVANQTGSTLLTQGWTATTTSLNVGDTFTIANVFTVNPNTKSVVPGLLQKFVVTTKTVTDAGGLSAIAISPAIVTSGPYQNVSGSPAALAPITVVGATGAVTSYSLAFEPDAFTFVSAPLAEPAVPAGDTYVDKDEETGIWIRTTKYFNGPNFTNNFRFDVLYGFAATYPQLAVKIAN
jgi:hypothetical protein